ncbi:segmentation protein cap'n'collar [Manduca sexta]|uniref:BZIP domain-containing protein n=1 Tax=Manduca sexta TaxID=7130 RepID=A0A921ZV86_MANSE|nr:segmentation protein cap'n'collar [Manduca sexta]KAG6464757.1 hypothetical protein O3G_MSEX014713 [Manduca sexta]
MGDNVKLTPSYQLDQEILDARGINMTVEEVAGLPTCKYSDRVHSLKLNEDDLAFLKGLRRRIKNRLASQNSRRRSVEHLRRLSRELRAVRACRHDALAERRALTVQRDAARGRCVALRRYLVQMLQERSDNDEVPQIEPEESHAKNGINKINTDIFQCRVDKIVSQSVNHIFKSDEKKIVAKTIFIDDAVKEDYLGGLKEEGVLNLSVKEGRRRGHGRKQSAPRRIVYDNGDDGVLDLKIKKEIK